MKGKTVKIIVVVVILLLIAGGFFFVEYKKRAGTLPGAKNDPKSKLVQNVETVFAVNTTKAVLGQINDYIELNGDVETKSSVDIYADTSGKLVRLPVAVGDRIVKDQVIALVDPSRPGSNFVASPVKSPISGTITNIPVYVGSTVTQATPIARVTTTDQLEIRTVVAERFISKMRVGLEAALGFEAYPGVVFRGFITELSPVVDPQTRTLEVKLRLAQPDVRIKSGMFAAVKIITEKKASIVKIPSDCLVKRFGGSFVFVVKTDPADPAKAFVERREVTAGIQIDNKLEILSGLAANEEIVYQGQTLLEDKSLVKVVGRVDPLPSNDTVQ